MCLVDIQKNVYKFKKQEKSFRKGANTEMFKSESDLLKRGMKWKQKNCSINWTFDLFLKIYTFLLSSYEICEHPDKYLYELTDAARPLTSLRFMFCTRAHKKELRW